MLLEGTMDLIIIIIIICNEDSVFSAWRELIA